MRITYDPDVDAMYIKLIDGEHQCRTVCLTEDIILDFAPGEVLVGIEILDARKILGGGKLPRVILDNIVAADVEKARGRIAPKTRKTRKTAA
jgi:uncharacterized protein YuzE